MAGATGVLLRMPRTSRHQPVSEAKVCQDFAKVLAWTLSTSSTVHPAGEVPPVVGFDDRDGAGRTKRRDGQSKSKPWNDVHPNIIHTPRPRSGSCHSTDTVATEASVHELSGNHHGDEIAVQNLPKDERNGTEEAKKEKKNALKRMKDGIVRTFTRRRTKEEKKKKDRESDELSKRKRGGSFFRSLRHSFGRKSKKNGDSDIGGLPQKESEAPLRPETQNRRDGPIKSIVEKSTQDDRDSIGSCSLAGISRKFSLPLPFADEDTVDWQGEEDAMVSSRPQPRRYRGLDGVDGGKASPPVKRNNSIEVDGGEDHRDSADLHDESLKDVAVFLKKETEPDLRLIGREIRRIGDSGNTWLRDAPDVRGTPTLDWQHVRAPPANQDLPTEPYDAQLNELEHELIEVLRDRADNMADRVCAWFARTVENFIGDTHTWNQVRFFAHFTVVVCRTVQDTGNAIPRLSELAQNYFQRSLAPWVAQNGGMANMPRVPRTRDSGEVD